MLNSEHIKPWFSMISDESLMPRFVAIRDIQRAVALDFGVTLTDILSDRRSPKVTLPRQVAAYLCRRITTRSYPLIGRQFDLHHTTIMHAVRQIERRQQSDAKLRDRVKKLIAALGAEV